MKLSKATPRIAANPAASRHAGRDDFAHEERYTPQEAIAGAIVVGVLMLALFGSILWRGIHQQCGDMATPDQSCAVSNSGAGLVKWSAEGMGSIPKSQHLP